jgi:hypothetical protein
MPEMDNSTSTANKAGETTEQSGKTTEDQAKQFKAPESQEELDRIVQSRLDRERSKYSDYEDLKAKADRLRELEEKDMSDAQKAEKRAEDAEKRAAALELEVLKRTVAEDKGVPAKLLSGNTKEELEDWADELLKTFAKKDDEGDKKRRRRGPSSDSLDRTDSTDLKGSTAEEFAAFFEDHI